MLWYGVVLFCAFAARGNAVPAIVPVTYDTIIVGMGASGCTAASTLCKAGKKVLALEATDRIGGRVHTVPFFDGVVELGAEWIHGQVGSRIYDLAIQYNVSVLPQGLDFNAFRSDGSTTDNDVLKDLLTFTLEVADESPKVPEPLGEYITRRLTDYIKKKYPDLLNDKDFMDNLLQFLDLLMDDYESSNNWNDVSTESKYEDLDGNQYLSWHRHGYMTLFEILLNSYNNGPGFPNLDIKFQKEVIQINWPQDPTQDVVVTCKDGTNYRAKNVIVTVSLGVLKDRHATLFTPPLPVEKATSIEKISIGVIGKVVLLFDTHSWHPNVDFFLFLWKGEDRKDISEEDNWITRVDEASVPMACRNAVTVWFSGDRAKLMETLPETEVQKKVMELIRRFMGKNGTIPEPTAILRSSWFSNPYTRGSYTYNNIHTPQFPNARASLAKPLVDNNGVPRVLFAGEATDNIHYATVHGATDTGFREANRLLPQAA